MKHLLQVLETQLAAQFPDVLASLGPPASHEEITKLEIIVKQDFPEEIKELYLWHNGSPQLTSEYPIDDQSHFLIYRGRWLSLREVLEQWQFLSQISFVDGEEYFFSIESDADTWNQQAIRPWTAPPLEWIPLSQRGHDDFVYIDNLPGPLGQTGQIVSHCIESGPSQLVANNLTSYLTAFTQALEQKKLRYDREYQQWLGIDEVLKNIKK